MKLKVVDRLMIMNKLLPQEANLVEAILVKDIREKVDFDQGELQALEIRFDESMVKWDKEKDKGVELAFSEAEIALLKKQVERLDREGKIPIQAIEVCVAIKEGKAS